MYIHTYLAGRTCAALPFPMWNKILFIYLFIICDLAAQIGSRISASPSRVILKPSLKSSPIRQILGLESDSNPSQDSSTTALKTTDMFSVPCK